MNRRRHIYQNGNAAEFDASLIKVFTKLKGAESAKVLVERFCFHSGHSHCIPTKRWFKHILYHLNKINRSHNYYLYANGYHKLTAEEIKLIVNTLYPQ